MIPITEIVGDATRPKTPGHKIIAHCCNDLGIWGAGFVLAISDRWNEPAYAYRKWKKEVGGTLPLGAVQFVSVESDIIIANIIGQQGIGFQGTRAPIRYRAIADGLIEVRIHAIPTKASVHMPRMGAGLAGGDWNHIRSLVEMHLSAFDIPVFVYTLP